MRGYGIAMVLAAAWPAAAIAQGSGGDSLSKNDLEIVAKVQHMNQNAVDLSRLAGTRADSKDVQDYADKLVQDHGAANDKLHSLVEGRGAIVPVLSPQDLANNPDEKKVANEANKLKNLTGKAFDREFTTFMVQDHENGIKAVRTLQEQAQDKELKSFLGNMIPTMQEHLRIARDLSQKVADGS